MIIDEAVDTVIFDMDGVLWLSTRVHAEAYRAVFEAFGLPQLDYVSLAGRRTADVFREQLGGAATPEVVDALTHAKQNLARALLFSQRPIAVGCVEVLSGTLARRKKIVLASSASRAGVDLFLEASGSRELFAAVVTGDDVERAKPAPDIYDCALTLAAADRLTTVVVEDAPAGVEAARAAGVRFVVGIEGTAPAQQLLQSGAKCVLKNLSELLE